MSGREWDFCDKCMLFDCCRRVERKKRDGCGDFEEYPWEIEIVEKARIDNLKSGLLHKV